MRNATGFSGIIASDRDNSISSCLDTLRNYLHACANQVHAVQTELFEIWEITVWASPTILVVRIEIALVTLKRRGGGPSDSMGSQTEGRAF